MAGDMPRAPVLQEGYALMAIMAIVAAAALVSIVEGLDARRTKLRRAEEAAAALQHAKAALIGYASSYRDVHDEENFGYLPCPDTTGLGSEQTPCGKAGKVAIGLLPYKTLGLPILRDAEGNCLWYAVSGSFKSNPKMVPFNWDTQGQFSVRDAAGVLRAAPNDDRGGAAAIVIAPGAALRSQFRGTSPGCADVAHPENYIEYENGVFFDGGFLDADGMPVANDRVAWITPKEIFDPIVKRGDFGAFISSGIAAIGEMLGSKKAGSGNSLPADNPFGKQTSNYNFYAGWKDQFRYLRCTPGCFVDGAGHNHDAVLLFGGRSKTGNPRPNTGRGLPDYFESALATAQGQAFDCSHDPVVFDNSSAAGQAADIALCLPP